MTYFNLNTWEGPMQRLVGVCAVAMGAIHVALPFIVLVFCITTSVLQ